MSEYDYTISDSTLNFLFNLPLNESKREAGLDLLFNLINYQQKQNYDLLGHDDFINMTTSSVISDIYYKKYYGEDKEQINKYKNRFLTNLSSQLIFYRGDSGRTFINTIEKQFSSFCTNTEMNKIVFKDIVIILLRQIEKKLKENPVKTCDFPRYISDQSSTTSQNNLELLSKILEKKDENNNNNQENQTTTIFSLSDLHQFYEILSKYTKSFSLSPKFVIVALKKFDNFLKALRSGTKESDNQDLFDYFQTIDRKSDEFNCFKIVLLIKMRLFLMINQMHGFLTVLLQLIVIEQEKPESNDSGDHFSFKKIVNEILPKVTTRRSTIMRNISQGQIIDFSFSYDEQNDYILTKEGVFKVNDQQMKRVDLFNGSEGDKISFSNGILYLFSSSNKTVHKAVVSEDEEMVKKAELKQKKLDTAKEHSEKQHKKKRENKEIKNENAKKAKSKENKVTNKKLREKEKKEKRIKRKMERYQDEGKREVDLESVRIDLPDYPVLSFNVHDNYARIVQEKTSKDNKSVLIFTNADLTPNDRINFNFEDAFDTTKIDKVIQTQNVIEIKFDEQNKMKNVLISDDFFYFSFEDYTFQKWMIYKDGRSEQFKTFNSPLIFNSNSMLKIDNKAFLYNIVPIQNEDDYGVSIKQLYIPETKHFLESEDSLFLKYPFLKNLSDIVNNCAQFIINRNIFTSFTIDDLRCHAEGQPPYSEDKAKKTNKFNLSVSPAEMSSLVQVYSIITPQLDGIKSLIKSIKDKSLQQFFITLLIKINGVNFLYEINKSLNSSILEAPIIENLQKFKSFILDLYALMPSNLMLKESIIFTFSIAGKYLFIPGNSHQELRDLMNQILIKDETKMLLKTFASFMFSYPSLLYFIDQPIYDNLLELKQEINIDELLKKSSFYILLENNYSEQIKNDEIVNSISPYINILFQYARNIINDESIPLSIAENILPYILSLDLQNPQLSLILEKELISISPGIFKRIQKIPGVLENDQEFLEKNQDLIKLDFHKEVKSIESLHPYNPKPVPVPYKEPPKMKDQQEFIFYRRKKPKGQKLTKTMYIEDIGTVDFGPNVDHIYLQIDNRSKLAEGDMIFVYAGFDIHMFRPEEDMFNNFFIIRSNKARIAIARNIKNSQEVKKQLWGCKLILRGVSSNDSYIWHPNFYLNLYGFFISVLMDAYNIANDSTLLQKDEEEFQLILKDNIIQGIKLEDIDNYEEKSIPVKDNKLNKLSKGISRGISRGISYDSQNESKYDIKIKKDFLNDIITINENRQTPAKRLLEALYQKTARQNRIRINQSNQQILVCERYFAACLFKQLGLITTCINFLQVINSTKKEDFANIEFPSCLLLLWKKIYSLRKTLFFEYQKSKSMAFTNPNENSNSNSQSSPSKYETLMRNVNQKCKLLLYSDPILQFKDKEKLDNDSYESAAKSILSYVTSKMPLSDISKLIDIRKKRLSISSQSLSLMASFVDQNLLFESSKPHFLFYYYATHPINHFLGVKQSEIEDYKKSLGSLVLKITRNIFTQQSISMITQQHLLVNSITQLQKSEFSIEISKIIIDLLNRNKSNKSFFNNYIEFILIHILTVTAFQTENSFLINYLVSLILDDQIDVYSKNFILLVIPAFIQFIPNANELKVLNESLAFSILSNSMKNPAIVNSSFYWLAFIIDNNKHITDKYQNFILKVLNGIGRAFVTKSCLFIDESYDSSAQNRIASSMITFIRLLFNNKNKNLLAVIHDILTNKMNNFEDEESLVILIGLFITFGQNLSKTEPHGSSSSHEYDSEIRTYSYNSVLLENKNLDLNEKEIDNILNLHEFLIHTKYFNDKQSYENEISYKEIVENVLIASFYSFLPIIMQIKSNSQILMNETNFKRTLSLFELATKPIPSKLNSIHLFTSFLILAINSMKKPYNSIKFVKGNYGEIIYSEKEDNYIIKSSIDHLCIYLCNRPFDYQCEIYYEVKVNKIGYKNIFIGFIDCQESNYNRSFGFGCLAYENVFCRKSPLYQDMLYKTADKIMKDEQADDQFLFKEGDTIGCYYTQDFTYLTINGKLTPYRVSNKSLQAYIPIIIIDHDQIELEVVKNITVVDKSNNKFDFLNVDKVPENFFEEKDVNYSVQANESNSYKYGETSKTNFIIGETIKIGCAFYKESDIETIYPYRKEYFDISSELITIKDIIPIENNPFVSKLIVESYNCKTFRKERFELDSRLAFSNKNIFLAIVENFSKTTFELGVVDLKILPEKLRNSSDISSIKKFIKNKMIKESSMVIAILMSRYLTFILFDYLRYSKSTLLQDERINSNEAQFLIKALAHSVPTITQFNPTFDSTIDKKNVDKYIIFSDEQIEENVEIDDFDDPRQIPRFLRDNMNRVEKLVFKSPGDSFMFNYSFKIFLKKSEEFISSKFLPMLLRETFNYTKDHSLTSSEIFDFIGCNKLESIYPLPDVFKCNVAVSKFPYLRHNSRGLIPILVSSIPDQLPCVSCFGKHLRVSSDRVSYFTPSNHNMKTNFSWKYNIEKLKKLEVNKNKSFDPKDYKNFRLKCGIYFIMNNLEELVMNSPLGFIQVVFIIFQAMIDSEYLYEKQKDVLCSDVLNYLLFLSTKKNPLVYPFIKPIIVSIIAMKGFSDYLINKKVVESFSYLSGSSNHVLYPMESFPSSNNELPLIFNLYTNLIEAQNNENEIKDQSSLFDEYSLINQEFFKQLTEMNPKYVEGSLDKQKRSFFEFNYNQRGIKEKKKNYQLIYLLYYYSILLNNESNLPYPKFLFVHDLIRQQFGGFQTVITKGDIEAYKKDENDEIHYKSSIYNNDFDLDCSCNLINIFSIEKMKAPRRVFRENAYYCVRNTGFSNRNGIFGNSNHDEKNKDKEKENEKEKDEEKEAYTIYVHQLSNDEKIELPQSGETVRVSFPLEILVCQKGDKNKKLSVGEAFMLNFHPSKEEQKHFFVDNFDELQEDFKQFISLGKYDSELSNIVITKNEKKKESTDNDEAPNVEIETEDTFSYRNFRFGYRMFGRHNANNNVNEKENRDDFKLFEIEQIPKEIKSQFSLPSGNVKPNIISLRYTILNKYSKLIESIMVTYADQQNAPMFGFQREITSWNIPLSSKGNLHNLYSTQIIRPAFSMNTESKFKFINQIFMSEKKETPTLEIVFNRFEQLKFMEKFDTSLPTNKEKTKALKARPLFVQFMEQVDDRSLSLLKVQGRNPFVTTLVGENAVDAGGPGRELFSSLIMEMMNEHIGIFTYNPNRRHGNKYTNKEDLIPNKFPENDIFSFENSSNDYLDYAGLRFVYAGALFAACIVSDLPQPLKVANFVWEYLSVEKVTIESIYEIDEDFKELIESAERSAKLSDEEFESSFLRTFEIRDSFDNVVQLKPSGSKKKVSKENLNEFIELAKNWRIHEFDFQLKDLKKGFDSVMSYKNITSILHPYELKILACGESNCSVDQMKKLFVVNVNGEKDHEVEEKMIKMFWNVMESFTPEERMLFIKFSSGNIGLPAPGLRWEKDIHVNIMKEKDFPMAHTCFSTVDLPFFESEEKLSRMLKPAINYGGMITDSHENTEAVAEFL